MKIDRKLAEAISTLRPHPAFEHLIAVMREDAANALVVTGSAEGTPLLRAQGKYQALKEWIEAFDEARALLDKPNFK